MARARAMRGCAASASPRRSRVDVDQRRARRACPASRHSSSRSSARSADEVDVAQREAGRRAGRSRSALAVEVAVVLDPGAGEHAARPARARTSRAAAGSRRRAGGLHGSAPTIRTSVSSATPNCARTASRARSIRRSTSPARAPPVFTMKFACSSEISGAALARALQPGGLDQPSREVARRVLEHRAARRLVDRLGGAALREQLLLALADRVGRRRASVREASRRARPRPAAARSCGSGSAARRASRSRTQRRPRGRTARPTSITSFTSRSRVPAFIAIQPPIVPGNADAELETGAAAARRRSA